MQQFDLPLIGFVAPHIILVKFAFRDRGLIPQGVPEKKRDSDSLMDMFHRELACKGALLWRTEAVAFLDRVAEARGNDYKDRGAVGRIRPGRVDEGEELRKTGSVEFSVLRRGLANYGYRLIDTHWFARAKDTGLQYTLVCGYADAANVESFPEVPRITIEALRDLSRTTWGNHNLWYNPNGLATLNSSGPQRGQRAKRTVAASDGVLTIVDL